MAPAKTRARVGREKGVPSPQSSTTRVLRKTTSRLTRSQSQGVEDAEEQVSLGRLRTRRGGPTIVENDKTSAKQRSGTGKGKRGGTVAYKRKRRNSEASELSAVSEEPPQKSPRKHTSSSIPETLVAPDDNVNISGTTILANDSQVEQPDLDPLLMLEALPDLFQASTNLLKFLIPSESTEEKLSEWVDRLQQQTIPTRDQKRLSRLTSVFETNKECFGSQKFINIPFVIQSFAFPEPGDDVDHLNRGLEKILQKANLAALALDLISFADSHSSEKLLLELCASFPSPFKGPFSESGGRESRENQKKFFWPTVDLALEIRTQFLLLSLESQRNENTFNLGIAQTVKLLSLSARCSDELLIREWGLGHFQERCNVILTARFKDNLRKRTKTIQQALSDDKERQKGLDLLRATFPWRTFTDQVGLWTQARAEHLNREPALEGNLHNVVEELQQELDREVGLPGMLPSVEQPEDVVENDVENDDHSEGESATQEIPRSLPDPQGSQLRSNDWAMLNIATLRRLKQRESNIHSEQEVSQPLTSHATERDDARAMLNIAALRRLKQRERNLHSEQEASRPLTSQATERDDAQAATSTGDTWETYDGGPEVSQSPNPTPQPSVQLNSRRGTEKSITKNTNVSKQRLKRSEAGFIDRQQHAHRVSPISFEESARRRDAKRRQRKIADLDGSHDDSGSEAFQQDNRSIDIEQSRTKKPKVINTSKSKQGRRNVSNGQTERHNSRPVTNRQASVSSFAPRDSPGHQSEEYSDDDSQPSDEEAERLTAPDTPPASQQRTKWSESETRRFTKLIQKFGTSWTIIKQADEKHPNGPKLAGRGQVALKDKARNLVMHHYKNQLSLPKNLDKVTLGKKYIDELAKLGIEYP